MTSFLPSLQSLCLATEPLLPTSCHNAWGLGRALACTGGKQEPVLPGQKPQGLGRVGTGPAVCQVLGTCCLTAFKISKLPLKYIIPMRKPWLREAG